jgi:tetratricopeptide (TPR) repeat protein
MDPAYVLVPVMSRVSAAARLGGLALLGVLAAPRVTLAQPPAATPEASRAEQARAEWERGRKLYNLADYEPAIAAFRRAYELSGKPELLYSIAQAYRLKGDCKQAVPIYRSFLREAPKHPNRRDAEAAIERCGQPASAAGAESPATAPLPPASLTPPPVTVPDPGAPTPAAPAASKPAPAPAPAPAPPPSWMAPKAGPSPVAPPPVEAPPLPAYPAPSATVVLKPGPPPQPGRTKKIIGLSVGGAGAALFVGGVLAGLKAKSAEKEVKDAYGAGGTWLPSLADREAEGKKAARTANVLFGLGAAAMAGGGFLYYLGVKQARAATTVGLSPSGVWLSGRF